MRTELGEKGRDATDEQQRRFEDRPVVPRLVLGEPFAVVVPPKLPEEFEQLRAEEGSDGHGQSQNRPQIRIPHSWRTPELQVRYSDTAMVAPSSIQRTRGPIPASPI